MSVISTKELSSFLETMYDFQIQDQRNSWCPLLLGAPGIGKTQFVEQLAEKKGVKVFHLILSQANPSEVCGMVMPGENNTTTIYDPKWASDLQDGDILFLDEILKAPKATLNSCLTLIEERRLSSGTHLPKVALFAAANPTRTMDQLEPELKQRLVRFNIKWDHKSWVSWVREQLDISPDVSMDTIANSISKQINAYECDTTWNAVTPRSVFKILKFGNDIGWEAALDMSKKMFREGYGLDVTNLIQDIINNNKPAPRQVILDTLARNNYDTTVLDWIEDDKEFADALKNYLTTEELERLFLDMTVEVKA